MRYGYKTVLVAVDGSEEAKSALNKGIQVAKDDGAKLVIAHVIDTRTFAAVEHYDRMVFSEAEKYAENLLDKYKQQATEAGVNEVEVVLEYGSPKVKISKDIVEKFDVNLVVTGATGLNTVERFLIGSVSEYIIRHVKCDVLIVREDYK